VQPIAIACGDPAGIGTEITLKAVADALSAVSPKVQFVLIGDRRLLLEWNARLGLKLALETAPDSHPSLVVKDPSPNARSQTPAAGSPEAARASLEYLRQGAEGCMRGDYAALVTAPVNKEAILRSGTRFVGQTEYLAEMTATPDVTMMLLGDNAAGQWLRVALVTTHLPVRDIPAAITRPAVLRAIHHGANACELLGLPRARIAVCGLNPHAGEGGMVGDEEARFIGPAITQANAAGRNAVGPLSADTVFHAAWRGDFEVVVAMYHDQGLPPLKLVAFDTGVNWTVGLPFPRTSPDHGTAYDIAGQGIADPSSMRAAIRLAVQLANARAKRETAPTHGAG
jgi:4-hydroxythreonine-4-phosphate dehydrogenase